MADKPFDAQIDAWLLKTANRLEGCTKQATQLVIREAQRSDDKGGRMRVDTGFLRNSGKAEIGKLPSGPGEGSKDRQYPEDYGQTTATLARWKIATETLFFGWTANYALKREQKDAFVRMAVIQWQKFVDQATAEMKRRFR